MAKRNPKAMIKERGHVMVPARGKLANITGDPTKVIGKRGKRVAVNKKRYAVSVGKRVGDSNPTTIKKRGKRMIVTKKVRSI